MCYESNSANKKKLLLKNFHSFPMIPMIVLKNMKSPNAIELFKMLLDNIIQPGRSLNYDCNQKNKQCSTIGVIIDWNVGGGVRRNLFIRANNGVFNINPKVHGFKTYYYGVGTLRK